MTLLKTLTFTTICFATTLTTILGQTHVSWDLDTAKQRIETHRKGTQKLQFVLPSGQKVAKQVNIKLALKQHAFHFGVSMTQSWKFYNEENPSATIKYRSKLKELFNFVTLGFYWAQIEKKEGSIHPPKSAISDMAWAKQHNMTLKGHPLLWHNTVPKWLHKVKDIEDIDAQITDHIKTLIQTYKEIQHWDVYNEAAAADIIAKREPENPVTRWVAYKGGINAAVKSAFDVCKHTDSSKTYTNNHYSYKMASFKELNAYLRKEKVENFDIVGIQTHLHQEGNILNQEQLWQFLEDYTAYDKPIHLTEVTVPSSGFFKNYKAQQAHIKSKKLALSTDQGEQFQAAYLKDFYTLAFSHPQVEAIIYWNGTDLGAWRNMALGLLDANQNPKPAYHTLHELIRKEWHTELETQTKHNGVLLLNGFYGIYEGELSHEGKVYQFSFDFTKKKSDTPLNIQLR